jgi:hypothetical protein
MEGTFHIWKVPSIYGLSPNFMRFVPQRSPSYLPIYGSIKCMEGDVPLGRFFMSPKKIFFGWAHVSIRDSKDVLRLLSMYPGVKIFFHFSLPLANFFFFQVPNGYIGGHWELTLTPHLWVLNFFFSRKPRK